MIRPAKHEYPVVVRIAAYMVIAALSLVFLHWAKAVLIPLSFAVIISMLLYPLCKFLEKNGIPRILAIILTFIIVLGLLTGLIYLLSRQIFGFAQDLPNVADRLNEKMDDLEWFMFKNFNIQIGSSTSLVQNSIQKFMDSGIVFVTGTISTFLEIFNFLGLLPIYVFLILMYRTAFKDFCMFVTPIDKHKVVKRVLVQIQKVVQNYVAGLFTVMLIVAILNTTALFIIGVDYAIFFGCFAAMLMVIPYLGMFTGALLAALYSLLTKDSPVTCLAIIGSMLFIQFVEGNFITPKITGNKVSINPLAAVLALVAGGFMWGMAGLIISLPVVAMLKVILDNIYSMKHLGFLLGTEIYKGDIQVTRNLKSSKDSK